MANKIMLIIKLNCYETEAVHLLSPDDDAMAMACGKECTNAAGSSDRDAFLFGEFESSPNLAIGLLSSFYVQLI